MKRTFVSVLAGLTSLVLGAGILGVAAPPARAVDGTASPILAQGVGMGAKPDRHVRSLQRILRAQGRSLGHPINNECLLRRLEQMLNKLTNVQRTEQ